HQGVGAFTQLTFFQEDALVFGIIQLQQERNLPAAASFREELRRQPGHVRSLAQTSSAYEGHPPGGSRPRGIRADYLPLAGLPRVFVGSFFLLGGVFLAAADEKTASLRIVGPGQRGELLAAQEEFLLLSGPAHRSMLSRQ